jgi:hypothetical protein
MMMTVFEENPSSANMVEQLYCEAKSQAREDAIRRYTPRFQEKLKTRESQDARRAFLAECWAAVDEPPDTWPPSGFEMEEDRIVPTQPGKRQPEAGKPSHFSSPENFLIRTIKLNDRNFLRRFAEHVAAQARPGQGLDDEALYQTYLKDYIAIFEKHQKSRAARLDFLKEHWRDRGADSPHL